MQDHHRNVDWYLVKSILNGFFIEKMQVIKP